MRWTPAAVQIELIAIAVQVERLGSWVAKDGDAALIDREELANRLRRVVRAIGETWGRS